MYVAVKSLQAISDKLKNVNWKVTERSCIEDGGFNNDNILDDDIVRKVTCDCTFQNNTICHITSMYVTFFLCIFLTVSIMQLSPNIFVKIKRLHCKLSLETTIELCSSR